MNQHFKNLIAATIVFIGMVLLLNLFIDNPYSHRLFRGYLDKHLLKEANIHLDFEAISIRAFPIGVDIYGLEIREKDFSTQMPRELLLSASHVKIRVSLFSIALDKTEVDLIEFNNLKTHLNEDTLRKIGFGKSEQEPKDSTPPLDIKIPIQKFKIKNGNIFITSKSPLNFEESPKSHLYADLSGIDIEANIRSLKKISGQFYIKNLDISENHRSLVEKGELSFAFSVLNDVYRFENTLLEASRLVVKGRSEIVFSDHSLSIKAEKNIQGNLSAIGSILDMQGTRGWFSGPFSIKSLIDKKDSQKNSLLIEGEVAFEDGYFSGIQLGSGQTALRIDKEKLEFKDALLLRSQNEHLYLNGFLKLNKNLDLSFTGGTKNLPFSNILDAFGTQISTVDLILDSTDLSISGKIDPLDLKVSANPEITKITSPAIHNSLGQKSIPGSCLGHLNLDITRERLNYNGTAIHCEKKEIDANTQIPQDSSIEEINSKSDQSLTHTFHSNVEINGETNFKNRKNDIEINLSTTDIKYFDALTQFGVSGQGHINVSVAGPFKDTETKISSRLDNLEWNSQKLRHLDLQLIIKNGILSSPKIFISNDHKSYLDLSSLTYVLDESRLKTRISAKNPPHAILQAIGKISQTDIHSYIKQIKRIEGEIDLDLNHPLKFTGEVDSEVSSVKFKGQKIADKISTSIFRNKEKIVIDLHSFASGKSDIKGRLDAILNPLSDKPIQSTTQGNFLASFGLTGSEECKLSLKTNPELGFKIVDLPVIGDMFANNQVNGKISLNSELEGQLNNLQGAIALKLLEASYHSAKFPDTKIVGSIVDHQLDFNVNHSGNALEGRVKIDLKSANLPYRWYLSFNRLDLRNLFGESFYQDPRNYAYFSGSWFLEGDLKNWLNSKGNLRIAQIQGKFAHENESQSSNTHLINRKPIVITFSPSDWMIENGESLEFISSGFFVKIGTKKGNSPTKIDLRIESRLDSKILESLNKQIESANGDIFISGSITGNITNPRLTLNSKSPPNPSNQLSINFLDLRPRIENIDYNMSLNEGILTINKFDATKGGGKIKANGQINLYGDSNVNSDVNIGFEQIKLQYSLPYLKRFDNNISGDLQLTGTKKPYRLTGDITINKSRSSQRFDIREELVKGLRQDTIANFATVDNSNPLLSFDLNINAHKSIQVQNKNLNLNLSSQLKIAGDTSKPQILGSIVANQGKFTYRRSFEVSRGEISFDNPVMIDPSLDIIANTEVGEYKVSIIVSGKASDPSVELLVDPATREDGTPISRLDAIILLSKGRLPDSGKQVAQSQGVGVSELLTLYSSQLPIDQLLQPFGENIELFFDWTTDKNGSPVLQVNVPFTLINDLGGVISSSQNEIKLSLEIPINESISSSFNQTTSSERSTDAEEGDEGTVDLRFHFPID